MRIRYLCCIVSVLQCRPRTRYAVPVLHAVLCAVIAAPNEKGTIRGSSITVPEVWNLNKIVLPRQAARLGILPNQCLSAAGGWGEKIGSKKGSKKNELLWLRIKSIKFTMTGTELRSACRGLHDSRLSK